jgi:copper homeostasis protein CutC
LVALGFTRILTSGGPDMAIDGVDALHPLCESAQGRIELLPAGGVGPANALEILTKSGADQLHGSFREARDEKRAIGMANKMLPNLTSIQRTQEILTTIKRRRESC